MEHYYALTFTTPLAASELFRRLRDGRVWSWMDRSSDRWGDYVSAIVRPGTMVKVFADEPAPGQCTANVRFASDASDAADQHAALRRILIEQILPAIDAREIREVPYLE